MGLGECRMMPRAEQGYNTVPILEMFTDKGRQYGVRRLAVEKKRRALAVVAAKKIDNGEMKKLRLMERGLFLAEDKTCSGSSNQRGHADCDRQAQQQGSGARSSIFS